MVHKPALVGAIGSAFTDAALQVSGYQNIYLAWTLGVVAFVCFVYAISDWIKVPAALICRPFGYMPISEAARISYQQTRGTASAGWAMVTADRGGSSAFETYVRYIGRYTSVPIFGVRSQMKYHEQVPKGLFKENDVEIRDDSLIHIKNPSNPLFTKLAIRRRDLAKAIEELKAI